MKTTEIKDGSIFHYLNGVPHNEDGPAIMHPNGATSYHIHGKFHRENGPAIEYADGRKSYYLHGIKYDEEKFWIQVQK